MKEMWSYDKTKRFDKSGKRWHFVSCYFDDPKIEYDDRPPKDAITMPVLLEKRLKKDKLMSLFNTLSPSRQKEVFKYLHSLKSEDAIARNIEKVVADLKNKQRQ